MPKTDRLLLDRARHMRANPTPAEQKLWYLLRAHRFQGFKFTRQVVIAPYIVDFAARHAKVVIEIDGDTHDATQDYDARRTALLETRGYRVTRFTNAEVMGNIEGVAEAIALAFGPLSLATAPLPDPLPRGERESKA